MTRFVSAPPTREDVVELVTYSSYTWKGDTSVQGYDADGREWTFGRQDLTKHQAIRLVAAIRDNGGRIDARHWFDRAPYGSQAYIDDGEEERLVYAERYEGFGEGDELAHVW